MRWVPGQRSKNIEDRRGAGGGGVGRAGMGLGGGAILLVLSLLFGRNLFDEVGPPPGPGGTVSATAGGDVQPVSETPEERERVEFVSFVLDDAQAVWARLLPSYQDARLVLFRDAVRSGCGVAESAVGPFYCPADQKVYIDLGFYDELRTRFGAPGDFAQAYVLTHEIGHHVQHLMGTDARVRQLQESRPRQANDLSVRVELQADCYAGVWANSTQQRRLLQEGDVEEALGAASAVGDDRIQSAATGSIRPESFTHGSAQQRASWFRRGFTSGRPDACDTFAGSI
ncbi:MAG: zinc metallopeptidase [Acidobacteriota bacterium]|nr:zinc metallopeptidase [Acidobacteriota bacterium]